MMMRSWYDNGCHGVRSPWSRIGPFPKDVKTWWCMCGMCAFRDFPGVILEHFLGVISNILGVLLELP